MARNLRLMFKLRSLAFDADGSSCRFDATPTNFDLLNRGSEPMIREMLSAMEIDATPSEWTVSPFCSFYYTQEPQAKDFHDHYPQAYAIAVRFAKPIAVPVRDPFRLYETTATDDTFDGTTDSFEWTRKRFIVIGDCFGRTWEELAPQIETVEKPEIRRLHPKVLQLRFDLGEVVFPDEEPRVLAFMKEAHSVCRSFMWRLSDKLGAS